MDALDMNQVNAMFTEWSARPPVHELVAAYLEYEGADVPLVHGQLESAQADEDIEREFMGLKHLMGMH